MDDDILVPIIDGNETAALYDVDPFHGPVGQFCFPGLSCSGSDGAG